MMPTPFSGPAGFITAPTEIDTLVMKNIGFQPRSWTLRIACAANFGVAATSSTSAPDALQRGDLAVDRRIGHLVGDAVTTILSNLSPSTSLTPAG